IGEGLIRTPRRGAHDPTRRYHTRNFFRRRFLPELDPSHGGRVARVVRRHGGAARAQAARREDRTRHRKSGRGHYRTQTAEIAGHGAAGRNPRCRETASAMDVRSRETPPVCRATGEGNDVPKQRKAPAGCYWRGRILWGEVQVRGQRIRWSLETDDPA